MMAFDQISGVRWLGVRYAPNPDDRSFLDRAQVQEKDGVKVTVAVLASGESEKFFGAPLARRGVQPVWLEIVNNQKDPLFFDPVHLDPNYFPAVEAAAVNHFAIGKRLASFGMMAWLFLPLLFLLPLKYFGARRANREMDDYFRAAAFPLGQIGANSSASGFVFTTRDDGSKVVNVRVLDYQALHEFTFSVPVPGLDLDVHRRSLDDLYAEISLTDCDETTLQEKLKQEPPTTTNRATSRHGDPLNLVIVADFSTILRTFGERWDETETISLATSWKTAKAFMFGSLYRYSPVSSLFLYGRSQDFALQRIRHSINQRLHLRLWLTVMRFEDKPVWIGQISRDIGVRFTPRTWNLTTHRIDPDVDEARDYLAADLFASKHLDRVGYIEGVGVSERTAPRRNLTGDPYITDGRRVVLMLAPKPTSAKFLRWNVAGH